VKGKSEKPPYYGYYFKILKARGNTPGGAYDYV